MKKTFPLTSPNHKPARVLDAIRRDVNKYVKRERRKELPDDVDYWDFGCRVGKDEETAPPVHLAEINKGIEQASAEDWPSVYIEILARPGRRTRKSGGSTNPSDRRESS